MWTIFELILLGYLVFSVFYAFFQAGRYATGYVKTVKGKSAAYYEVFGAVILIAIIVGVALHW